jgi:hypothetical protein
MSSWRTWATNCEHRSTASSGWPNRSSINGAVLLMNPSRSSCCSSHPAGATCSTWSTIFSTSPKSKPECWNIIRSSSPWTKSVSPVSPLSGARRPGNPSPLPILMRLPSPLFPPIYASSNKSWWTCWPMLSSSRRRVVRWPCRSILTPTKSSFNSPS